MSMPPPMHPLCTAAITGLGHWKKNKNNRSLTEKNQPYSTSKLPIILRIFYKALQIWNSY